MILTTSQLLDRRGMAEFPFNVDFNVDFVVVDFYNFLLKLISDCTLNSFL